jgi:hypothetical protein
VAFRSSRDTLFAANRAIVDVRGMLGNFWEGLERVKGIEPSYSAWKAAALPLSYTRAGDQLSRRASGLNRPAS